MPAVSSRNTILVVDDELLILRFVVSVLQSAGYVVLEALGGWDALRILETYQDAVQLLVTDVNMAPMNGVDLAQAVRSVRPSIRVLYMTGFTKEFLSDEVISKHSELLRKPFSPVLLLETVRAILEGSISTS